MLITKLTSEYHIAVKNNDRIREEILKKIIEKSERLVRERKIKTTYESETTITKEVMKEELEILEKEITSCSTEERVAYENKLAILKEYLNK